MLVDFRVVLSTNLFGVFVVFWVTFLCHFWLTGPPNMVILEAFWAPNSQKDAGDVVSGRISAVFFRDMFYLLFLEGSRTEKV